jgi:hypothetical protein
MSEPNENPYAAPPTTEQIEAPPPTEGRRAPYALWIAVVLINLPVPVMFGMTTTTGFGRIGMPFGILLVGAVGLLLCKEYRVMMRNLSMGAIATALSQFYPVLHIFVGIMATGICGGTTDRASPGMDGIIQITVATIITGVGLILPSLVVGYLFAWIGSQFRGSR